MNASEIIIVRSLTDSDMGFFSAHQKATTSKQRAIALTAAAAQQLLHPSVIKTKGAEFDCICIFGSTPNREPRLINKAGKNWRLGGRRLPGDVFAGLDSKDFALIRSVRHNDGSSPILLTFVGRKSHRFLQAGLAITFENQLRQSVAIFQDDSAEFETLAELFPSVPANLAVQPSIQPAAFL